MKVERVEPSTVVYALHHHAPDVPNLVLVSNAQSIKEYRIIWNTGRHTLIVVNITVYSNFSTVKSYLRNQFGMPIQYDCRDKECWRSIVLLKSIYYSVQGMSNWRFRKTKAGKNSS